MDPAIFQNAARNYFVDLGMSDMGSLYGGESSCSEQPGEMLHGMSKLSIHFRPNILRQNNKNLTIIKV